MALNNELWNKIVAFDFDLQQGEYNFSVRLADENNWTQNFTKEAILEYKKFMYLAANSNTMVSPSEIVDIVWHQHLIFSHSYQNFCKLIGRNVQHIPSTHHAAEYGTFAQAKDHTRALYEQYFGLQPNGIWEHKTMYGSLHLEHDNIDTNSYKIIGAAAVCLLTTWFVYKGLKSFYIGFGNPTFLIGFITLIVMTAGLLFFYNQWQLNRWIQSIDKDSFLYKLTPYELIYLKTKSMTNVINGNIQELIDKQQITVNEQFIELIDASPNDVPEQQAIIDTIGDKQKLEYKDLLPAVQQRAIFKNLKTNMDAIKKYCYQSKILQYLGFINIGMLVMLLILGFNRLGLGMEREKPVLFIGITMFIFVIFCTAFFPMLQNMLFKTIIPNIYIDKIIPKVECDWSWNYAMYNNTLLTGSFAVLISSQQQQNNGDGGGSACGSGDGGGGGCGGGCGGCGS